jgi:hypothetical protein
MEGSRATGAKRRIAGFDTGSVPHRSRRRLNTMFKRLLTASISAAPAGAVRMYDGHGTGSGVFGR